MAKVSKVQERLSDKLDKQLLDVVKKGVPLYDKDGDAVVDAKGKPVYGPPTAAYMNVARQRLRDLGITSTVPAGSAADKLAEECGLKDPDFKVRMPELSDESDAATG